MLISSRNTLTVIPRSNVLPATWASPSPEKLTPRSNHHRGSVRLVLERTRFVHTSGPLHVLFPQPGRLFSGASCGSSPPILRSHCSDAAFSLRPFGPSLLVSPALLLHYCSSWLLSIPVLRTMHISTPSARNGSPTREAIGGYFIIAVSREVCGP